MVKNMPKKYYTRIIENELDQMLGIFGAVLIEGPKWCGKTTTAGTRAASSSSMPSGSVISPGSFSFVLGSHLPMAIAS